MQDLYFVLAAGHIVAVVVTGALWTFIVLAPGTKLRTHLRDIRAVHFGSLFLVPWLLGLAWAFERLEVPAWHQAFFPAGLGLLVLFSGIGWLFPLPEGHDPFHFWTTGWGLVFSMIGLACFVATLCWTAAVLAAYAVW